MQSLLSVQAEIFFLINLTTHQENQIQEREEQEKITQDGIKHSELKTAYYNKYRLNLRKVNSESARIAELFANERKSTPWLLDKPRSHPNLFS